MTEIRQYMQTHNIGLREMARRSDISAGHLCKILHGKARITDRNARKLAKAMKIRAWHKLVSE